MTRSRRFFASSPWIATGTPDYVNLGYTSRGLAKQALMRLSRKSLAIFRKLGLEDLIAVVDGRAELVGEIQAAQSDVRSYLAKEITKLLGTRGFGDALPGHLAPDSASQDRIT